MDNKTSWVSLPHTDEPLRSVTHVGNGKDADIVIEFADGRRIELGVATVRVEADRGVVIETSALDDLSLEISYTGPNLLLRHGRIGFSDDERWRAEIVDSARAWIESGCGGELSYAVYVELRLASAQ
jgi:hypothetical protein